MKLLFRKIKMKRPAELKEIMLETKLIKRESDGCLGERETNSVSWNR